MRTLRLPVPSPAIPKRLDRFIVVNVPELSRRQVKGLIDAQQVRVNSRAEGRAGRMLKPGDLVEVNYRPSWRDPKATQPLEVRAHGEGWWVVHKPAGLSSHPDSDEDRSSIAGILANTLELPLGEATAVHRLDRGTSGLLLVAVSGGPRARLSALFENHTIHKQYLAVVHPAPSDEEGELSGPPIDGRPTDLKWRLLRRSDDGSRAELEVEPHQGRTHQIRIQLAAAGWPIVGDLEYGRPLPGGAPRMALHASRLRCEDFDLNWPQPQSWDELLEPQQAPPQATPTEAHSGDKKRRDKARSSQKPPPGSRKVEISKASVRIIHGGHPWLLKDRWTGDLQGLEDGDTAWLVDDRGDYVATALLDPSNDLCGRVVSRDREETIIPATFEQRGWDAGERRRELLADPSTNAFRLVHGEADGLPGLAVDLWGDVLVATLSTAAARDMASAAYRGLRGRVGDLALYERDHFVDLRRRDHQGDARLPGRWIETPSTEQPDSWQVLERSHSFSVSPLDGLTTGLYPDQRDNRDRLKSLVHEQDGAQIANLFSHTGAFSVSCAAAGAARVWSIDLSRPYSDLARLNLQENGLCPDQHPVVVADARGWLRDEQPKLDGVILDPPGRASGRRTGDRGWSTKRDYRGLVSLAAERMQRGGWMLCCCNLRGAPRGWLEREIKAALKEAGRSKSQFRQAFASSDFPALRGFPEGRCFQAVLVLLDR